MMRATSIRVRQLSLAWLIIAVMVHGHMQTDFTGTCPQSSGLMRLGRDFVRKFAVKEYIEITSNSALAASFKSETMGARGAESWKFITKIY
jgi:hypothetical protein